MPGGENNPNKKARLLAQAGLLHTPDTSTVIDTCLTVMREESYNPKKIIDKQIQQIIKGSDTPPVTRGTEGTDARKSSIKLLSSLRQLFKDSDSDHRNNTEAQTFIVDKLADPNTPEPAKAALQNINNEMNQTDQTLSQYCLNSGLPDMYRIMLEQARYKHETEMVRAHNASSTLALEKTKTDLITRCADALKDDSKESSDFKAYCKKQLNPTATPNTSSEKPAQTGAKKPAQKPADQPKPAPSAKTGKPEKPAEPPKAASGAAENKPKSGA